jgi:hypothetical protein
VLDSIIRLSLKPVNYAARKANNGHDLKYYFKFQATATAELVGNLKKLYF